MFSLDSAIFSHLERDFCASGVTWKLINEWAFDCYQAKHYTNNMNDEYPYHCPACGDNFKYASSLLQHAETTDCDKTTSPALEKMKRYVSEQVRDYDESRASSSSS